MPESGVTNRTKPSRRIWIGRRKESNPQKGIEEYSEVLRRR